MVGVQAIASISAFYFLIVCTTYIILRHVFKKDRKTVMIILISAIAVRIFVYLLFNLLIASNGFHFPDSVKYDNKGWNCAQDGIEVNRYSKVTCLFYTIFGHLVSLPEIFNVLLGAWICVLLFLITKSIFDKQSAGIVAVLAVLYPSLIFWSTQLLKDTLVLFLAVLIFYIFIKHESKNTALNVLIGVLIFTLGIFRFYIALMIAGVILFSFFALQTRQIRKYLFPSICLVLSVLLAFNFLGLDSFLFRYSHSAVSEEKVHVIRIKQDDNTEKVIKAGFVSKINDILGKLHKGRTAYDREWEIKKSYDLIKLIPSGAVYLFFSPFPWQAGRFDEYIFNIEMIIWYALVPFVLFGLYFFIRNKKTLPMWLFALGLSLFYTVFSGSVGTIIRWRLPIFAVLLIPAGIGISKAIDYFEEKGWLGSKYYT